MKTDCIHMDDCYLPARLCTDDCERYKTEDHPFAIAENRACAEHHIKKDMGEYNES